MAHGGQTKRMAVGGISAQPTAMPQMQQRPQQNMMNMQAQLPSAGQGRQFAMQQMQHPQMGGINPHPQMGGPQPTGRGGGINPRPPQVTNPYPTGPGDMQLLAVDTSINPATGKPYEGNMLAGAAGGVVKKLPTAKQMGAMGMKKGGRVKETMGPRSMKEDVERGSNRHLKHGESAVQKKGHTKGKNLGDSGKTVGIERGPKHFAKGGHVKSIDGIARRGHTKVKYR